MDRETAIKILKTIIECDEKFLSGKCDKDCENCKLSYYQGTGADRINAFKTAIIALKYEKDKYDKFYNTGYAEGFKNGRNELYEDIKTLMNND